MMATTHPHRQHTVWESVASYTSAPQAHRMAKQTRSIHDGHSTSAQAAYGMGICGKLYQLTSTTLNGKANTMSSIMATTNPHRRLCTPARIVNTVWEKM